MAVGAAPLTVAGYLAVLVTTAVVPVAVGWLTKLLLDRLAAGAEPFQLEVLALGLGVAGIAVGTAPHLARYLRGQMERAVGLVALRRLFGAVNGFTGVERFEDPAFLDRLRLAQQSCVGVPSGIVDAVFTIATGGLTAAGFIGSLAVISPPAVVAVLVGAVPVLAAELSLARRRASTMLRISPSQRRELIFTSMLYDRHAANEIRLFDIGDFLLDLVVAGRRSANRVQQALDRRTLALQWWLGLLGATVTGGVVLWAVLGAHAGRLTIGDVALLVAALAGVQNALVALVRAVAEGHRNLLMFAHFTAIVDDGGEPERAVATALPPVLRHGIELRDVWFRYAANLPWVLRGVDLFVPAGQVVALVGHNGAGKSTLVKLLCRFYEPTRGSIRWDGVDLRDLEPAELRHRMGVVFQDFVQYDVSAATNVAIGDLSALHDRPRIQDAARRAGIHDTLCALPRGYDTLLTRILLGVEDPEEQEDTGVQLSGGQWQRIALARALIRDSCEFLILDEPNSGLDARAEDEIRQALHALSGKTTSLLISHRLGTVRHADRIVVLDQGRVVEQGDHDRLMATGGLYADLFRRQTRAYTGTERT